MSVVEAEHGIAHSHREEQRLMQHPRRVGEPFQQTVHRSCHERAAALNVQLRLARRGTLRSVLVLIGGQTTEVVLEKKT